MNWRWITQYQLKKNDPFEKANYRLISLLPSLSKVYEKLIYQKLNIFFENKWSPPVCGSVQGIVLSTHCKWYKWNSCLDNFGVAVTVLMDLSKAFNCLPHKFILAKLHTYGVDIKSLKLLQNYLSNQSQTSKSQTWFYLQFMVEDSLRLSTRIYPRPIIF